MPYPFLLLLLLTLSAGSLATFAFGRFVPAKGATTAAADVVEEKVAQSRLRTWVRGRLDPALLTGLALSAAAALAIGGGLLVGLLAYLVRGDDALRSVDSGAADWGHAHATQLSTHLLWWVTDLGDWPAVPVIAIAIGLLELYRAPNRYLVPFLVVVIAGDEVVTNAIKAAVDRARPTLNPIAATLGPSFPSGHSSTAASFYAALALILARRRSPRTRALLTGGACAAAVAVASSRVLLDAHWLTDVLAGLALGWAWFALSAIAFGGRLMRFAAPVKQAASTPTPTPKGLRCAASASEREGVGPRSAGNLRP